MGKINCMIIEDEPLAAEILQDYILHIPFLHLMAVCNDAISALEMLKKKKVELVFLDIHLPKLRGLDFVKALQHPPEIIITTAYREYALDGYELNVLDYLVKPVSFERFLTAAGKAGARAVAAKSNRPSLFFNVNKKMIKVYLDEIIYIESVKEYIRIVSGGKTILTKMQLGQIEEELPKHDFIRVHRSFLVAKDKIESFTSTDIEAGGKQIPIGRNYKELTISLMQHEL